MLLMSELAEILIVEVTDSPTLREDLERNEL
jgi:hypothetical protein